MLLPAPTKTEQVRQAILTQILSGALRPGGRLLEAKLSKEFGVAQATVNNALQDLHNQGFVTKLANRSNHVVRYNLDQIERLFAVRILLEPAAAAAVAERWSPDCRELLQQYVDRMRRSARTHDLAKWRVADFDFHQEVYRLTGNPYLVQAAQAIAAAPVAHILCDHPQALPVDYLSLAEDHQDIILGMEEGPDAAAHATRCRIEEWLSHSRHALRHAQASAVPTG